MEIMKEAENWDYDEETDGSVAGTVDAWVVQHWKAVEEVAEHVHSERSDGGQEPPDHGEVGVVLH